MKTIPLLSDCPNCHHELRLTRLECPGCDLQLSGHFQTQPLQQMGADDLQFIALFLHCEGSIRDMEKALGVSYPTVKARLAAINSRLQGSTPGPTASAGAPTADRPAKKSKSPPKNILDQLAVGEVDFATALAAIKNQKG